MSVSNSQSITLDPGQSLGPSGKFEFWDWNEDGIIDMKDVRKLKYSKSNHFQIHHIERVGIFLSFLPSFENKS